jgi:hypothetical protein
VKVQQDDSLYLGVISSGEGPFWREGRSPSRFATPFHGLQEQVLSCKPAAGEGGRGVGVVMDLLTLDQVLIHKFPDFDKAMHVLASQIFLFLLTLV